MKNLLFISFIFYYGLVNSQDNYSFGYKDGFTKGCNCYDNPPSNDYIFRKGGYDQGYYDGQIDGKFYKLESTKTETRKNPYENLPMYKPTSSPYLQQGMAQKQQLINDRRLQLTAIHKEIFAIASTPTTLTEAQHKDWETYQNKLKTYLSQDLSDSTFFNSVVSWMYDWKAYFKTWL